MMYHIEDTAAAVYEIQKMLRLITRADGGEPCVVPDGIYGEETYNCVRGFQESVGLQVTGYVDYPTFEALCEAYKIRSVEEKGINKTAIIPKKLNDSVIAPGERSAVVRIIQAMLSTLRVIYDYPEIEINGLYDSATIEAVKRVQRVNGLPVDGIIDKATWNALSDEYEKFKDADM